MFLYNDKSLQQNFLSFLHPKSSKIWKMQYISVWKKPTEGSSSGLPSTLLLSSILDLQLLKVLRKTRNDRTIKLKMLMLMKISQIFKILKEKNKLSLFLYKKSSNKKKKSQKRRKERKKNQMRMEIQLKKRNLKQLQLRKKINQEEFHPIKI